VKEGNRVASSSEALLRLSNVIIRGEAAGTRDKKKPLKAKGPRRSGGKRNYPQTRIITMREREEGSLDFSVEHRETRV